MHPLQIEANDRDRIVFLTCGVAVLTLVIQGGTTRLLVQGLGLARAEPAELQVFERACAGVEAALQEDVRRYKVKICWVYYTYFFFLLQLVYFKHMLLETCGIRAHGRLLHMELRDDYASTRWHAHRCAQSTIPLLIKGCTRTPCHRG